MKTKFLIVMTAFFCGLNVIECQVPRYAFNVYFEDSKGNVDSIRYVYDESIDKKADRIRFGQVDITNIPFNKEFEVRGADLGGQEYQSKLIASGYLNWFCEDGWAKYNSINIRAENFPVRMYWDRDYFLEEECLVWSRFSRYWGFKQFPTAYGRSAYTLMAEESEFVITKEWLINSEDFRNIYQHSVTGGGTDTIYVIWIGIASEFADNVGVDDVHYSTLELSPNPVFDNLKIDVEDEITGNWEYELYSIDGKVVKSSKGSHAIESINVESLREGLYYLILRTEESQYLGKFIKG